MRQTAMLNFNALPNSSPIDSKTKGVASILKRVHANHEEKPPRPFDGSPEAKREAIRRFMSACADKNGWCNLIFLHVNPLDSIWCRYRGGRAQLSPDNE